MTASVFVFNPFAEGYIALGRAYTPAKHQAMLAQDLANLTQFLCQADDIVLLAKRPSLGFLNFLKQDGFPRSCAVSSLVQHFLCEEGVMQMPFDQSAQL